MARPIDRNNDFPQSNEKFGSGVVHAWSMYENYEVDAKGKIITSSTIYYYMDLTKR